jgi:hypothetical protein
MCMDEWCWRKRPLIVNIESGEMMKSVTAPDAFFGRFLFSQIKAPPPPQDTHLVSSFPINDPCNGETSKSEEGVARWLSSFAVSCSRGSVAPFWSEWQSPMSKLITPQQSESVCPRGIQHYRSIVDRYKISEREGVDKLFY